MGPADVELLLDLRGALVSGYPRGERLELDFAFQVPIPRTVRRTLEQCGEFRGGALLTQGLVGTELGELHGQEVETEVPRAAEAGLYTEGDKGRLCALAHAQLVRAQHADAAPGAVQRLQVRAREKEKIKKRLDAVPTRDTGTGAMRSSTPLMSSNGSSAQPLCWRCTTPNHETRIEVDASGYATGGVLMQKQDDGRWHPVAFGSHAMDPAQCNYEIYNKKMLAIIEALYEWRHYLEGLPTQFEIITDHKNLEYWCTSQHLTPRQV
ncbi:hypothetical protein IEO21_10611 [Rhodonia placenta]|uniref:Reverse transcriptase RNase H-like domain-containing protein n=1 Tax=Rhodonia placenta TaxID=104341 RepID=A0A8H7TXD4_9APHY|nr:hypothetical protein IEO21_10611 [Postia placenta]